MDGKCFSLVIIGSKRSLEKIFFLHIATGGWMGGYSDHLRMATGGWMGGCIVCFEDCYNGWMGG